jgi:hypothetical protein
MSASTELAQANLIGNLQKLRDLVTGQRVEMIHSTALSICQNVRSLFWATNVTVGGKCVSSAARHTGGRW